MTKETQSLPLSTDQIMKIFEEESHYLNINYNESALKGEAFLTYIANMKMQCDIEDYQLIPPEDKKELIRLFSSFKYLISPKILSLALASVMLYSRTKEMVFDFFTPSEAEEFIAENRKMIDDLTLFVDSMLITIPAFSTEFKENVFDKEIEEGKIKVIDDPDIIGVNCFSLLSIPHFIDMFIGASTEVELMTPTYFKYQVEDLYYNKTSFFKLITDLNKDSFILSLFNMLSSTEEEVVTLFEKKAQ